MTEDDDDFNPVNGYGISLCILLAGMMIILMLKDMGVLPQ